MKNAWYTRYFMCVCTVLGTNKCSKNEFHNVSKFRDSTALQFLYLEDEVIPYS